MMEKDLRKWLEEELGKHEERCNRGKKERKDAFKNLSGIEIKRLYTPLDYHPDHKEYGEKVNFPGVYPYTRGLYPGMYRQRIWTKRMLAGYGAPEDFNQRVKTLLDAGETGINVPAPSVSMRGYDTDRMAEELDKGYVGLYGTPLDTLTDSMISFQDIPIHEVSVNYSDPGPFVSIAMHFAQAKKRGISWKNLRGTTNQGDFLSHWVNSHMFVIFPLESHLKVLIDHVRWCIEHAPKWHPLSLIGQHASQSGATPAQELAFVMAAGIFYMEELQRAGLDVDSFAPRVGGFFDGDINIFEQAAKLRASRRMWAKIMRQRFGAKDPKSWQFPIHVQTSGVELSRQKPLLNIARVAFQALGAVLGGTQSLHTDSYDEAITIPSKEAALLALMTQHVLSDETGVADVIDPLAGSYYFEDLTDKIEAAAWRLIEEIENRGGMFAAVKEGFVNQQINRSINAAFEESKRGEKVMVGVNAYQDQEEDEAEFESFQTDPRLVERQMERTKNTRKDRDQDTAKKALDTLRQAAEEDGEGSIFGSVIAAVEAQCTRGEIVFTLREILGYGQPGTII